jgi:hypothetical protein
MSSLGSGSTRDLRPFSPFHSLEGFKQQLESLTQRPSDSVKLITKDRIKRFGENGLAVLDELQRQQETASSLPRTNKEPLTPYEGPTREDLNETSRYLAYLATIEGDLEIAQRLQQLSFDVAAHVDDGKGSIEGPTPTDSFSNTANWVTRINELGTQLPARTHRLYFQFSPLLVAFLQFRSKEKWTIEELQREKKITDGTNAILEKERDEWKQKAEELQQAAEENEGWVNNRELTEQKIENLQAQLRQAPTQAVIERLQARDLEQKRLQEVYTTLREQERSQLNAKIQQLEQTIKDREEQDKADRLDTRRLLEEQYLYGDNPLTGEGPPGFS